MSFMGGWNAAANQTINMQNMAMVEQEIEMATDLFNRLVSSCHKKCIPTTYLEGDLNKGEAVCIDRCVAKYFEVNKSIGTKFQQMSGQAGQAGGSFPM
ncbi:protein transporter tim10 [Actinomortierella wolfii]|nr:protein transporter tim10 [Actinomortierella wolfii]KAG0244026.1 protein transporter tim10 [Actinomortierella wolfii]